MVWSDHMLLCVVLENILVRDYPYVHDLAIFVQALTER